jgi:hypothetical protein
MKALLSIIALTQLLLLLPLNEAVAVDADSLSKSYTYEKLSDSVDLYWRRLGEEEIEFNLYYKSATWFGFGLSSDGSMMNTDAVVGWQNKDGTGHFSDRHSREDGILKVDQKHNWFLIGITNLTDSTVQLQVKRKIMLCDSDREDLDIRSGDLFLIFSSGKNAATELNSQWSSKKVKMFRDEAFACPPEPQKIVFESKPTGFYKDHVVLMPGAYEFYWNFTDTDIIGEIHVKTEGWVGFGLSPNGKMSDSDVIIGWIDADKKVNFTVIQLRNLRNYSLKKDLSKL